MNKIGMTDGLENASKIGQDCNGGTTIYIRRLQKRRVSMIIRRALAQLEQLLDERPTIIAARIIFGNDLKASASPPLICSALEHLARKPDKIKKYPYDLETPPMWKPLHRSPVEERSNQKVVVQRVYPPSRMILRVCLLWSVPLNVNRKSCSVHTDSADYRGLPNHSPLMSLNHSL